MGYFKRQVTPVQLTDADIILLLLCIENEEQRIADIQEDEGNNLNLQHYSDNVTALYHSIDKQR